MIELSAQLEGGDQVLSSLSALAQNINTLATRASEDAATTLVAELRGSINDRSGELSASLGVSRTADGAQITGTAYFWFVLLGTGARGAAQALPGSLFPDGYGYGPRPGMVGNARMQSVWAGAPSIISDRVNTLFAETIPW